jgi:hypothetical protein
MENEQQNGDDDFLNWLKQHRLNTYEQVLQEEGFESLLSLSELSKDEVEELSGAISMKLGHKKVFVVAINKERIRREKEEAKREREEEEQDEQRKLEKQEQQEQRKLELELSKIERERILNEAKEKARSNRDAEDQEHTDAKPKAPTSAAEPAQNRSTDLPAWKDFAAFLSHNKMHTKFGDNSETISIRLKV